MDSINKTSLIQALSNLFEVPVIDTIFETAELQGGTVGDVCRVSGEAIFAESRESYSLVLKTQRKWERYGDPDCWRREYDIYKAGAETEFPNQIKLPRCLLLEEDENVTKIWMEFIQGTTGNKQLHADELALAVERLGSFQADFYRNGRADSPFLRSYPAVCSSFHFWWNRMKDLLRQNIAGFPDDLRHILNSYAEKAEELLDSFNTIPLTFCQGDVHHDNLILKEENGTISVYLIDWDCAGYGHMGEDAVDVLMEAFVYSDRDVSLLPEFRRRIITSYCKGVESQGLNFEMSDTLVKDIFALAWGFRLADLYLYYKEEYLKQRCIEILYVMFE